MKFTALGENYNKIAEWWTAQMEGSDYGMKYVRKAMSLAKKNSKVLDIGCGSSGRTIDEALKHKASQCSLPPIRGRRSAT